MNFMMGLTKATINKWPTAIADQHVEDAGGDKNQESELVAKMIPMATWTNMKMVLLSSMTVM